jgi:hypothetical protein
LRISAAAAVGQVGDVLGEADCVKGLGDVALARSDHDAARKAYKDALPLYRQVGNVLGEANCIAAAGQLRQGVQNSCRPCEKSA